MANAVVIYYSYWGNTEKCAQAIAGQLGTKAYKIEEKKERKGIPGMVRGAFEAVGGTAAAIRQLDVNSSYDTVFLGCPVWSAAPAPAMVSFIQETDLTGKQIILFLTHVFGDTKKCVMNLVARVKARGGKVARAFAIKTLFVKEETIVREAVKIAEAVK